MKAFYIAIVTYTVVFVLICEINEVKSKWVTFSEFLGHYRSNKPEMAEIVGVACKDRRKKRDDSGICRTVY